MPKRGGSEKASSIFAKFMALSPEEQAAVRRRFEMGLPLADDTNNQISSSSAQQAFAHSQNTYPDQAELERMATEQFARGTLTEEPGGIASRTRSRTRAGRRKTKKAGRRTRRR